jgi:hypothetical protein
MMIHGRYSTEIRLLRPKWGRCGLYPCSGRLKKLIVSDASSTCDIGLSSHHYAGLHFPVNGNAVQQMLVKKIGICFGQIYKIRQASYFGFKFVERMYSPPSRGPPEATRSAGGDSFG